MSDLFVELFVALLLIYGSHTLTLREELYLTKVEQLGFDKFKAEALPIITTEYMKSDIVLKKYFRAFDYNENKTLEVLKENIKWRLEQGFENMTEDEINNYKKMYPYSSFKDKLGRGVIFMIFKYWDLSAATKSHELAAKFTKFAFHLFDEVYALGVSNLTGATASGVVTLNDFNEVDIGKSLCATCIQILKDCVSVAELRWPGGLQAAYALNAPPLLRPTVSLIKSVLSKKLQESMFAYDFNDAEWMPVLMEFMDEDKLPGDLYIRSKQQGTNHSVPAPTLNFFVPNPINIHK